MYLIQNQSILAGKEKKGWEQFSVLKYEKEDIRCLWWSAVLFDFIIVIIWFLI